MKRFRRKSWIVWVSAIVVIALMLVAEEACWTAPNESEGDSKEPAPITNMTFAELSKKLTPAVVNISTTRVLQQNPFFSGPNPFGEQSPFQEFWERFFGGQMPKEFKTKSLGSGVIIDKEGHIVTNNHVIKDATEIVVILSNQKEYNAGVVGKDPKTDLALIRIDAGKDLKTATLGNSDQLQVGEWVIAIGNPFGLSETITAGIVSAKGRVIGAGPYDDFIQTDASINPGNSGGPLFNFWGEVVGINSAIVAQGQGIGFAIPINIVKEVVSQLKEKGKVVRGWLGIGVQQVTPQLAESFGLKEAKGALVSQVYKDTPADKAGIQQGDVILKFNGKEVNSAHDLPQLVANTSPGTEVTITILRDGKRRKLETTIVEMEKEEMVAKEPAEKSLGMSVQNITPPLAERLGLEDTQGAVVTGVEPGSLASDAGIARGDVVLEINRNPVEDVSAFKQEIKSAMKGKNILFLIRRGDRNLYLAVETS